MAANPTYGRMDRVAVTIAAGASLSAAIPLTGTLVGIDLPAPNAWTTADVTFQASSDHSSGTPAFSDLYFGLAATEYKIVIGNVPALRAPRLPRPMPRLFTFSS